MFLPPSSMFLTGECREPNPLLLLAPPLPHSSPIALIHTQSDHLQLVYNRPPNRHLAGLSPAHLSLNHLLKCLPGDSSPAGKANQKVCLLTTGPSALACLNPFVSETPAVNNAIVIKDSVKLEFMPHIF